MQWLWSLSRRCSSGLGFGHMLSIPSLLKCLLPPAASVEQQQPSSLSHQFFHPFDCSPVPMKCTNTVKDLFIHHRSITIYYIFQLLEEINYNSYYLNLKDQQEFLHVSAHFMKSLNLENLSRSPV